MDSTWNPWRKVKTLVGDTEDHSCRLALSTWVMDDLADVGRRHQRRGWLEAPRTWVRRYRHGSCVRWQTRRASSTSWVVGDTEEAGGT